MTITELAKQARKCTSCSLSETRTQVVFGVGGIERRVVVIGEGPGLYEDLGGFPLVGPSGHFLDELLATCFLNRETVYTTNIVKCRSTKLNGSRVENAPPPPDCVSSCKTWLDQELDIIKPLVIICLGAESARVILGRRSSIARDSEKWHTDHPYAPAQVRVLYHPAYIMRQSGTSRSEMEVKFREELAECKKQAEILKEHLQ